MTPEQMERAIEFLLDHHAKFSADIDQLKESQTALVEAQARTSDTVERLAGVVSELADSVSRLEAQAETDRQEIREAIGHLITANENTRNYAQEIARLATQTERRVTDLENRQ
jgi:hypothetical protein